MSAASLHPGLSIAVKLVIATSVVVAATVATSSFYALAQAKETAQVEQRWRDRANAAAAQFEARQTALIAAQALDYVITGEAFVEVPRVMGDEIGAVDALYGPAGEQPRVSVVWYMVWDAEANPREAVSALRDGVREGLTPGPDGLIYRSDLAPKTAGEIVDFDRRFAAVPLGERRNNITAMPDGPTRYVFRLPIGLGSYTRAYLWIGISTQGLHAEIAKLTEQVRTHVARLRLKLWLSSGVALLLGIILAMLQAMSMARPIGVLSVQASRMAQGDFDHRVPEDRRDEIGVLARNFNFMADRIGELLLEQAEKAALEHEMGLARSVQQAMLPPAQVERIGDVSVVGYCAPASSCGGDWWMRRELSNGRILIVIGDATGHGIHSAMIAATGRGAVEALAGFDDKAITPEQVLRAIDSAIRSGGEHHVLMTAFAAIIDLHSGMLSFANAGQNFPYIVHTDDDGKLEKAAILATAGNPLGDRDIKLEIRSGARQLHKGDLFVCFTDGLVERANRAGQLYGDRRLLRLLRGQAVADGLDALRLRVMNAVDAYADGADANDDVTFVLALYDPPALPQALRRAGTA